jgi:hypothetical protein
MSRRAWIVFAVVQALGAAAAFAGEFAASSALRSQIAPAGFFFLIPGNLIAELVIVNAAASPVRSIFFFVPIAIIANAGAWFAAAKALAWGRRTRTAVEESFK